VEKIGAGGMGEVYRAEDTKLRRQVAIKVVPEDLARDENLMGRFEREARILASLNHPHIAAIYDLVDAEGTRAIILELVEGPTLFEHIVAAEASGRSGLPLGEALTIALHIAEGLEAAHGGFQSSPRSHSGGSSYAIHVAPLDGSAPREVVRESDRLELPESWATNGDVLAFTRREPDTGSDVWILPLSGDGAPLAFLSSRFEEGEARFSYDGRWLAYQSDESGQTEIYVRSFPGPGGKRQISVDGGTQPRWRRDDRELYFRRGEAVMAVDVSEGAAFEAAVPRALFEGPAPDKSLETRTWDALPEGDGFVFIQEYAQPRTSINLVLGWFDELRELDQQARR
jgi:hypothetical protein